VVSSVMNFPAGVAVSGSFAYVAAHYSDSLVVIDVSNPVSPVIRGSVVSSSLPDGPLNVAVSGSYAYVAAANSLVVVDVSNPVSPVIQGRDDSRQRPRGGRVIAPWPSRESDRDH
jgi:hypothetical protein